MEQEYFAALDDLINDDFDWDSFFNITGAAYSSTPEPHAPPPSRSPPPPTPSTPATAGRAPEDPFRYTDHLRSFLVDSEIEGKVTAVLDFMKGQGLNLELFLDAVFWGNAACRLNRTVMHERTSVLGSPTLGALLRRLWNPPTRAKSQDQTMREFVFEAVGEVLEREMKNVATVLTPEADALSEKNLTSVDFRAIGNTLKNSAARELWALFERLSTTARQLKENTMKDPFLVILMAIVMFSYSRSSHVCLIPVVWSIFLKSCGVSARAFDALHAMGMTMSHKWTAVAYTQISSNAMHATRLAICDFPHFGSHDNLNIPMRVFSQRIFNKNHFINASAATIWVLPKEAFDFLLPDLRDRVQQQRREASARPLPLQEIYQPSRESINRVRTQGKFRILRFLLESPEFRDYAHREDSLFAPPPPTNLLPCGDACIVRQHILKTVEVDESSYDGTDQLCNEIWPRQMGYITCEEDKRKIGTERLVVWVGDQLTVDRIRGLARYRFDDPNSYDRMDWYEPHFGWFHALMAVANSLHSQYLGTSAGIGLRKAFEVLGRKGLMSQETKGPFWHHLDEALWHIAEGSFRALWCEVGRVEDLAELKKRTPAEIMAMLDTLYSEHASREALVRSRCAPAEDRDEIKEHMVMFSMDILPYLDLREAIRIGDVGRMEDLLPLLLMRFMGGGNHKYAVELLELLQKLKSEWPDDLRRYIQRYCWLINRTGKRDGFFPVDLGQEHNIKDIKFTWKSFGPGATFDYIQKISPAITTLRAVRDRITSQFPSLLGRGSRHGTPSKDIDVARITQMYKASKAHCRVLGRRVGTSVADRAADYVDLGSDKLMTDALFERWWSDRNFERSQQEIYTLEDDARMQVDP